MRATTDCNLAMSCDERATPCVNRNDTGRIAATWCDAQGTEDVATHDGSDADRTTSRSINISTTTPDPDDYRYLVTSSRTSTLTTSSNAQLAHYKVREVAAIVRETDQVHCRTPGLPITPLNDLEGRSFPDDRVIPSVKMAEIAAGSLR